MKIGNEVEGKRYINCPSIFCDASEINKLPEILKKYQVEQIYISDYQNILDLSDTSLLKKYNDKIITIERTKINKNVLKKFNIVLIVDNLSFWNLKPNDHIKFTKNLEVYVTQFKNMIYTSPDKFIGDIQI